MAKSTTTPHIYFLLDRSGSMEAMRADVIGGFNNLVADLQAAGPDARISVVQFDSQNPAEVVIDAQRIPKAHPLTPETFVPRGGTPLLDATGRIIIRAATRVQERALLGKKPEDITVVTITDGHENQSREFTRQDIMKLVKAKEAEGWAFAYLGAGIDAYAEAADLGYDHRSTQAYAADGTGTAAAFANASQSINRKRALLRAGAPIDKGDFYFGDKSAEADKTERGK